MGYLHKMGCGKMGNMHQGGNLGILANLRIIHLAGQSG